ncbi:MAG TPA: hypothetical protein QF361_11530 [Gammaproteobacteria bacterium]|nr:hypothetical protein [Gammaproteobacteria bacterium]
MVGNRRSGVSRPGARRGLRWLALGLLQLAPVLALAQPVHTLYWQDDEGPVRIVLPRASAPVPLILLSPPLLTDERWWASIAAAWAARGYVVVTPRHRDASNAPLPNPFALRHRDLRGERLWQLLWALPERVPAIAARWDGERLGLLGAGAGAADMAALAARLQSAPLPVVAIDRPRLALVLVNPPAVLAAPDVPTLWASDRRGCRWRCEARRRAALTPFAGDAPGDAFVLSLSPDLSGGGAIWGRVGGGFWDAYLKDAPAGLAVFEQDGLGRQTAQRAQASAR